MLSLVPVGVAASEDVVTSTRSFAIRYNITSLAYAGPLACMTLTCFQSVDTIPWSSDAW